LLGAALLAAVIAATLHISEERAFIRLIERAQPWWLAAAFALQAATYLAQGSIWRRVTTAAGCPLSRSTAFELGLAKLFADQALPSGGLSSAMLITKALERRHVPATAVRASVLVDIASYHAAYGLALLAALGIASQGGYANLFVVTPAVLFLLFSVGLSVTVFVLTGRSHDRFEALTRRSSTARKMLTFVSNADPRLVRSPHVLAGTIGWHAVIVLLDAATVWMLIRALGESVSIGGAFASFMIASLFRTLGVVPGGLGTFEATSVLMLRMIGVDLAVALSATLLFRGLSFWLPMVPGYWFSRRAIVRGGNEHACEVWKSRQAKFPRAYWSVDVRELARQLGSGTSGLTDADAAERLQACGPNRLREARQLSRVLVLARQVRSPLQFLLVFAAAASLMTGEWFDAGLVMTIVLATVTVGYSREYSAQAAADALRSRLRARTTVLRNGQSESVLSEEIVPGDTVLLAAGSLVPADAVVVEASDFHVSEAVLTGESFPVQKRAGITASDAPLGKRQNCVYLGTNVRSGTARCLVVATGSATEFGAIAHRLTLRPPETEFDRGIRHFGYLLTGAMSILVLLVFVAHMLGGRPPIETLLFAVALAVGLSPELLPAILAVSLARGARVMAEGGVLVRRLSAIENLGSMDVLCTDKTGTLTEGVVQVEGAYDAVGDPSPRVLHLAAVNAALETGISSPLDEAITRACRRPDLQDVVKLAEIPFDFVRKRVTVVVRDATGICFVTKGAFHHVLEVCTHVDGGAAIGPRERDALERRFEGWSRQGIRVLAVATSRVEPQSDYTRADEQQFTFVGFVTFLDQPKEGVDEALCDLARLGVSVKLITGDSELVARHVASRVGLRTDRVLTGRDLDELHDEALWHAAERTDLFVEVDPNQKERIILSLKKVGHVVGFLGDGVNDAPAMHAADTSLSVEQAVDVAREAADFVLLERGLDVIRRGIDEGRRTFANTLKYVLITTSANLGNMVSMAAASLLLPFLPLTAGQILLNNFVSDIPAVGIADDSVDPELVARPGRWDMRFVGRYMVEFGALSSAFDFVTFAALLVVFRAGPEVFRTGWFVESLLTELVVAIVIRTRRPFYSSRPGALLLASTVALIALALATPYLPLVGVVGFVPLPPRLLATLVVITALYVAATELQKRRFYRNNHAGAN
jgi:Mg2+-importing ATPase